MQKFRLTFGLLTICTAASCLTENPQSTRDASSSHVGGESLDAAAPGGGDGGLLDTGGSVVVEDAGQETRDGSQTPVPHDGGAREDAATEMPGSPGCSATRTLSAGDSSRTLRVGSTERTYLVHVPSSYQGGRAVPLVLDFHPLLSSATSHRASSGYLALSDREGFIVAYPNGVDPAWNVGPCCTRRRDVDDLGFARALVDELKREACIDPKRVYAVGFSNGGGMTHHLACHAADVFAAVAPAAFDLLVEAEQPCSPSRPISIKMYRSTNDSIVPYAGGASTPPTLLLGYSLDTIHFEGAQGSFERWARLNQCSGTPSTAGNCKTYGTCAGGVHVTLCTTNNGHATGPAEDGWATLKQFTLP